MTYSWGHNRRFNAYSNYFKQTFGGRIQKVTIDAGFTCPNRDGTISYGGCAYCNNNGFNPSYCTPGKPVSQQIEEGMAFHRHRYKNAKKYLAYFQAFSNTYAPLEQLKKIYNQALEKEDIVGLVIGTRPDCIDEAKLDYFQKLSENFYIILEYGVESTYNKSLERINRGHSFETAQEIIEKTAQRKIKTGAHFIFGLPGETREEMLSQVKTISNLPLTNIKFHQLQIVKGTAFEKEYIKDPWQFELFSLDEYLVFMKRFMERLNPAFVVERISSEAKPSLLIQPKWGKIRGDQILNRFEKLLETEDTWQGKYYQP